MTIKFKIMSIGTWCCGWAGTEEGVPRTKARFWEVAAGVSTE